MHIYFAASGSSIWERISLRKKPWTSSNKNKKKLNCHVCKLLPILYSIENFLSFNRCIIDNKKKIVKNEVYIHYTSYLLTSE